MPFEILTWVDPMNELGGQVPSGGGANLGLIAKQGISGGSQSHSVSDSSDAAVSCRYYSKLFELISLLSFSVYLVLQVPCLLTFSKFSNIFLSLIHI